MNYKVLYRKYRPDNFENLVGQDNITKILKNSVSSDKLAHAYIFSGPRGTGKTSSAKIFAKNVNCLESKDGNACGECSNCLNYNNSNDIIEIDAASNNGVDEIREITNNIKLSPNLLKYKVYIIDEVHMLSQSAFNALLLTLEEPPVHVIFILATTNIESVPITILSRCQRFDFRKIQKKDIISRLKVIAEKENINITDDALEEIASLADGGLRDSLSILDQLSKETEKITYEFILNSLGNVSGKNVVKLLDLLDKNDYKEINNLLNELSEKSIDYKLLIKNLIEESSKMVIKLLDGEKSRLSVTEYKKFIFDLVDCLNKNNISVDIYDLLKVVFNSYIDYSLKDSRVIKEPKTNELANTQEKNDKKEELVKNEKISAKKGKKVNNNKVAIRINNCFAGVNKQFKNEYENIWKEYKEEASNQIKGIIIDSCVVAASEKIIMIKLDREKDIDMLYDYVSELKKEFNDKYEKLVEFVFLTSNDWDKNKTDYMNNIKNGIKYEYIEEADVADDVIGNIFGSIEIEIEEG